MTTEEKAAQRAAQREKAARDLTVAGSVGLALRDHRRRLGLSQRAYAAVRGWSASHVARLETGAGRFSLDDVVDALVGTGFSIALVRPGQADAPAEVVDPGSWPEVELVARIRDGSRRFPAHHETEAAISPPTWWWHREFFHGLGPAPQWYAPRPSRAPWVRSDDDAA
ncbi:helix-turn-helix domain-containing protein [Knoellia sp. LjRoot47]|uniref:helix-turn-helix domain-containing protein n=1 Tax=Knoellia sp. LjRoot47 TaxID=3342330 RepID=UPI003ECE0E5F